jgi:hypothetical protein
MEDIKKLTIQSVEIAKQGFKKDGSSYTLYRAKTDDGFYSFFDMALQPGETTTFKVKIEPSGRFNPKTQEEYMNRTIVGYTGSIDNMPAKPYRTSSEATSPTLAGLEQRIAALELHTGINLLNEKADPDNNIGVSESSTMLQDTTLAAYETIRAHLNEKQRKVRYVLQKFGPMTDKQIAEALGWEINRVTPRRGELGKLGELEDLATVPGHTGRPVHLWKLKEEPASNPEQSPSLF